MMKLFKRFEKSKVIAALFIAVEACIILLGVMFLATSRFYQALGCLLWGVVLCYLFIINPLSPFHHQSFLTADKQRTKRENIITASVCTLLILACIIPMGAAPAYNGEFPQHRNQYELLAQSMKNGHIYIEYDDVDPILEQINPYDPAQRIEANAAYHSDNAYYKGHYYMYFGVVPVILLFLPYLIITGQDLTTYHATQIFAAFAIIGIFLLFRQMAKKYFPTMSYVMLLSLSTAFATICVYFSVGTPALYCTATTSGVCMVVWSLYFFIRAIYLTSAEKTWRRVILATLGSLFGALAFGCRPTAALANLVLIPFFIEYLRTELPYSNSKKKAIQLAGRICIIALPYVIIGVLLMLYNYCRFENPFEFGQAYQLTSADQSQYGNFFENFSTVRTVNGLLYNFIGFTPIIGEFPFVYYNSAFVNFPILLIGFAVLSENVRKKAKEYKMRLFLMILFILPVLITVMQIAWAPGNGSAERYRMDIYCILTLFAFLVIGFLNETIPKAKRGTWGAVICLFCLEVIMICPLFLLFPDDYNYTHWYPESLSVWRQIIMLH